MIKELREKIRKDISEVYGDEWESADIQIENRTEMRPFSIKLDFANKPVFHQVAGEKKG
jgi:hypothetical protein